ncbi:hypothetical protein ACET8U_22585 [Aeromonas veronii]
MLALGSVPCRQFGEDVKDEGSVSSHRSSVPELHSVSERGSFQSLNNSSFYLPTANMLGISPPNDHKRNENFVASSQLEPGEVNNRKNENDIQQVRTRAQEAEQAANKCGVNVAKRTFFAKLLTLAAASAALVTAALITGFSGGAAIPLLALAGVGFTIAVGDAGCALKDWLNKKNGKEGLPSGADSLANILHAIATKLRMNPEKIHKFASYTSGATRAALILATVFCGGFLAGPGALPSWLKDAALYANTGKVAAELMGGLAGQSASIKNQEATQHRMREKELNGRMDGLDGMVQSLRGSIKQALQGSGADAYHGTVGSAVMNTSAFA